MDFHSIINAAKQNVSEADYRNSKYYKSKFEPPKKTTKEKKLTSGIKRFLEKQKIEEEEKIRLAQERKQELLARRDPKEQRKIEKTLKVIKSSKKFYTGDKELDENTEVTLQNNIGDNDDYDFESKHSDAFYQKLMEKYKKMPQEDKFSKSSSKASKSAAQKPDEDSDEFHIKTGHRERVSKIKSDPSTSSNGMSKKSQPSSTTTSHSSKSDSTIEKQKPQAPAEKPKPKIRPAPIVNFEQLLKLAEQKQHEDIVINMPSKKEPERLLTSKEKRELEEIEAARKAKKNGTMARIPKLGAIPKLSDSSKQDKNNNSDKDSKLSQKTPQSDRKFDKSDSKVQPRADPKSNDIDRNKSLPSKSAMTNPSSSSGSKLRDALVKNERSSMNSSSPTLSKNMQQRPQVPHASSAKNQPQSNGNSSKMSSTSKMSPPLKSSSSNGVSNGGTSSSSKMDKQKLQPKEAAKLPKEPQKSRDFPPKDLMRSREFPPKDLMRTREFPPKDLKRSREFPPRDMKRPLSHQQMARKRRVIEDEDSEDEYDSELDDFIDDGDADCDYSNEIQKIFGYDKSRYRDEDFDDREMESDYRTVMREEYISKKIGLMEDLEDMRMEAEENRRKEMMKKKRRKV